MKQLSHQEQSWKQVSHPVLGWTVDTAKPPGTGLDTTQPPVPWAGHGSATRHNIKTRLGLWEKFMKQLESPQPPA